MKTVFTVSAAAALLVAGSAWAAPYNDLETFGKAGSPSADYRYEPNAALSWSADRDNLNYSESASTVYHRDYLAERDTSLTGQPGVGTEMGRTDEGRNISGPANRDDILSWDNYSERGSTAYHRDFQQE